MKRRFLLLATVVMILIMFSPLALAQMGKLEGYVKDEQGLVLPGVTVTLQSPSLMRERVATSDSRGYFSFTLLPPGRYRLQLEMEGFAGSIRENILVRVAQTTTENFVMKMAALAETIVVTAERPLVDVRKTDQSFNIDKQALSTLPLAPRHTYRDAWQMLPGVTVNPGSSESAHVNAGDLAMVAEPQRRWQEDSFESRVYIDGLPVNDAMSGRQFKEINYEAIEEIDIKTSGYEAEYGVGRAGQMQIVTKSGGNDFHASFLLQYQPVSFNWTNVEGGTSKKLSYLEPTVTISGPIKRDKIWFLFSIRNEHQDYERENVVWMDKMVEETRGHPWYAKFTTELTPHHRLSVTGGNDHIDIKHRGDPYYDTADTLNYRTKGGWNWSLNYTWVPSDKAIFQLLGGKNTIQDWTISEGQGGARFRYYDRYRGNLVRNENNYYRDYHSWRKSAYARTSVTYFADRILNTGPHEFKVGAELYPENHVSRDRAYNYQTFGPLDLVYEVRLGLDYENYGLSEPYVWQVATTYPSNFFYNEPICHLYAVYVQDTWSISDKLTANIGLRWDYSDQDMRFRDEMPSFLDEVHPHIRDIREFEDTGFAPRMGFSYDAGKYGVFRSSFGKYYEFVGTGDYNNYPVAIAFYTYRVRPEDFGKGPEYLYLYRSGTVPVNPNFDSPNCEMEYNWKYTLNYEREIPGNMALELSYIYQWHRNLEGEDINGIYSADGQFLGRVWPDFDIITMRGWYDGDERRRLFKYQSFQVNVRRNFTEKMGWMANFSKFWRKEDWLRFSPYGTDRFVFSSADDLDRTNYGISWAWKVAAFYQLPWDVLLSGFVTGVSGQFIVSYDGDYGFYDSAPTIVLPNGRRVSDAAWLARNSYYAGKSWGSVGRYTDNEYMVNLRFQKGFSIKQYTAEIAVDFFNIFNFTAWRNFRSYDVRSDRYDLTSNPQEPRVAQIRFRLTF